VLSSPTTAANDVSFVSSVQKRIGRRTVTKLCKQRVTVVNCELSWEQAAVGFGTLPATTSHAVPVTNSHTVTKFTIQE
jgi:hypothetical protein